VESNIFCNQLSFNIKYQTMTEAKGPQSPAPKRSVEETFGEPLQIEVITGVQNGFRVLETLDDPGAFVTREIPGGDVELVRRSEISVEELRRCIAAEVIRARRHTPLTILSNLSPEERFEILTEIGIRLAEELAGRRPE
jgi:hypothetical protein